MEESQRQMQFSDDEVREVLRRALALEDRKSSSLSLDELHHIASEIGIGNESLTLAIREVREPLTANLGLIRFAKPIAWLGGGGLVAGLTSMLLQQTYDFAFPIPVLVVLMFSGGAAFGAARKPRVQALLEFQAKNAVLFAGFTAAVVAVLASGSVAGPGVFTLKYMVANLAWIWGAASALGGAAVLARSPSGMSDDKNGSGTEGRVRQWKRYARVRLKALVDRLFAELRGFQADALIARRSGNVESGSALL